MTWLMLLLSLTLTIYNEAGGQSQAEMQQVADVVINRVHSQQFPDTVTGVIYQEYQFDWTRKYRHYTLEDLQRAQKIMTNRYERGQGSSPQKWRMAMEIAEKSLQQGYQPKNNYLYFRASGGKNKFYGNAKHFKRIRH